MRSPPQTNLKSSGLLILFTLVGISVGVPIEIVHGAIQDQRAYRSHQQVEHIALCFALQRHAMGRSPATATHSMTDLPAGVEPDQKDAWGTPLRIQYLRDSHGIARGVAVWSAGPNGTFDTPITRRLVGSQIDFEGDDIGAVRLF